jgi:8-oxo-dGTP diphosphatase/2-hydroxy-dATP diphosphatase
MKKILTLVLIHQGDKVLLGMKKRGFGMGRWNGFGGKVHEGESIEAAAKRELFEESELSANTLEKMGVLEFSWKDKAADILEVHIFKVTDFSGKPRETEEMKPQWFLVKDIPFKEMWADDIFWFPLFFEGKRFEGKFLFDVNDTVVDYTLHESHSN